MNGPAPDAMGEKAAAPRGRRCSGQRSPAPTEGVWLGQPRGLGRGGWAVARPGLNCEGERGSSLGEPDRVCPTLLAASDVQLEPTALIAA